MNQPKIYDEGGSYYRFHRRMPDGSMPMRRYEVRPRHDVPDSPGWVWFLTGAVCGAILLALVVS